jgi:chemotaxis protein MotB
MARPAKSDRAPVIIRRQEVVEGGHHGGAWKIAYADFVTAMMAFFLLMWLVNATTESQKRGISDYFAPVNPLGRAPTGSGKPFGGTTLTSEGKLISDGGAAPALQRPDPQASAEDAEDEGVEPPPRGAARPSPAVAAAEGMPAAERRERAVLAQAAEEIRAAVRGDRALEGLARQLVIEEVPEGLRIQVVDEASQPVFASGQAAPNERGRALLQRAAVVLATLAHPVEVTGHTDATPFRGGTDRSNWDLSTERANATRRLLVEAGVAETRIRAVAGRADRDPLRPDQPLDPVNRRVAVLVLMPKPAAGAAP